MVALVLLLWFVLPLFAADEPCALGEAPSEACPGARLADDEGWIDLPSAPGDFGSALDALGGGRDDAADGERASTSDEQATGPATDAAGAPDRAPALLRSRWGVRPRVSAVGRVEGDWGLALGGSLTHQWWAITDRRARGVGETRLDLSGRVGRIEGPDLRLISAHGVWLGPVGLMAGGALRVDRYADTAPELPLALTGGPHGRVALLLGPAVPWGAFTPAWVLAGERSPVGDVDEWTAEAGLDLDARPMTYRFSGALRETGTGRLWETGFGLHLHF